ncbi:hypothetical protein [Mangrovibacter yixingensis]|uniref:hypothetical protein n=1 Tax=Mangrovibacter yixingensis TaxID=1529639 RepID=UPI001CF98A40|nr:hypothetical protein [Mangrovibacter yixingensis]
MSAINHIKNPLTIIGIFAGIVEVSANLVLPFLDGTQQGTYIWFLMIFPSLLVLLFFVTLNFNHVALYAPSDYNDDRGFMQANNKIIGNNVQDADTTQGFELT